MQDNVRISVINEEIYPVNDLLFGQFLERPSWGGESGPEAALLPGTNKLDPRVESLLRTMDIPIVRFPGGSDVDYLDWRDMVTDAHGKGAGRPDTRKWEKQPITNVFGYDEYFHLAADLKWKSILVFNLRDGLLTDKTPAESAAHAAALLAYFVGTETSVPEEMRQWPALRATNGHPEPYKVEYVQIGNEAWFFAKDMKNKYGDAWITPWADTIQLYIAALRRIKPDIKVIADGHPLEISAELHRRKAGVDFFALHWYYPMGVSELFAADGKKLTESEVTAKQVWETMTHCIETNPEGLAEWKDASIDQAKRLGYKLAVTEWNLNAWGNFQRRDELWPGAGACGLGAAVMLNAILRGGSTFELATQSMLVGQAWGISGIRVYPKTGKAPVIVPTAEAVTLYNHYHGDRGLRVNYEVPPELWKPEIKFNATPSPCAKAAFVDVLATRDQEKLYVHAINTDFEKPRSVTLQLDGFGSLPAESTVHRLKFHTMTEFKSTNSWTSQETVQIPLDASSITIELPTRSMTVAVFALPRMESKSGKRL